VKLHVDRLSDSPTPFRFELTPAWWREVSGGSENDAEGVAEGFAAELHAHKMGADVYLEGELRGALALECGRCLARYRQPVREAFRLVLEPAGDRIPADPEGAAALARDGLYLSDELEAGWFRCAGKTAAACVRAAEWIATASRVAARRRARALPSPRSAVCATR
jgi:hypothetical protein